MLNRLSATNISSNWSPPPPPNGATFVSSVGSFRDTSFTSLSVDDAIEKALNRASAILNSRGQAVVPQGVVAQRFKFSISSQHFTTEYMGYSSFCGVYDCGHHGCSTCNLCGNCCGRPDLSYVIACHWWGICDFQCWNHCTYQCDRFWYRSYNMFERFVYIPHQWQYEKDVVLDYSQWASGAVNHRG